MTWKRKLIQNSVLRTFVEQLESGEQPPLVLINFLVDEIKKNVEFYPFEHDDIVEFSLFNRIYVCYVNYIGKIRILPKSRYEYLIGRKKI